MFESETIVSIRVVQKQPQKAYQLGHVYCKPEIVNFFLYLGIFIYFATSNFIRDNLKLREFLFLIDLTDFPMYLHLVLRDLSDGHAEYPVLPSV